MVIDPTTGDIISKKDAFNKRHRWEQTLKNPNQWECTKCKCIKKQTGEKEFIYILNEIFEKAPECNNSKLTIIKKEKNERSKQGVQLSIGF